MQNTNERILTLMTKPLHHKIGNGEKKYKNFLVLRILPILIVCSQRIKGIFTRCIVINDDYNTIHCLMITNH